MKAAGQTRRGIWRWAVSFALAGILLYVSLRGVDWGRVWRIIVTADWRWLLVSCAIMCFSFFLRSLRWRILLNAEADLDVGLVFWATMAGYLGNNFLPARAGELVRTYFISARSALSKTYVLTTALSERSMDVIALVLWSSFLLLRVKPKPGWMESVSRTTAVIGVAAAVAIAILPHAGGLLERLLQRVPMPGLRQRLQHLMQEVLLGMRAFHDVRRFAGFGLFTAVIWTADAFSTIAGARGLGITMSFPVAMLLLAGLGLGSALPSTPGYVGIYQFVAVTVLVPFGINRDAALAYILVSQALSYVIVLLLGLPGWYRAPVSKAAPGGLEELGR
ncbi:MAG TPA: lysylphosphatidylglycerol synthase transmembrane domain-containing protein [Bryobacteraceae bacterium]|nr:lysylphosphatidylglycerol synthase transmembrane domain-containing protein [Bryobacteraceae bacterium]